MVIICAAIGSWRGRTGSRKDLFGAPAPHPAPQPGRGPAETLPGPRSHPTRPSRVLLPPESASLRSRDPLLTQGQSFFGLSLFFTLLVGRRSSFSSLRFSHVLLHSPISASFLVARCISGSTPACFWTPLFLATSEVAAGAMAG